MKNGKFMNFLVKILVSLTFVGWLILKVDWKEVLFYIKEIKFIYVAIYFGVLICGMVISAYKWKLLAKFKNMDFPLIDFFKFYLAGTLVNNFMPSFIGGDTFRAYQIGRSEKKYKEAASTVIVDRITGLFGAIILTIFFSVLNFGVVFENELLVFANLTVAGALIGGMIFLVVRKKPFWKKTANFLPEKVFNFAGILNGFAQGEILKKALTLSIIFSLVGLAGANLVLFYSLEIEIGLLDYLSVIFLISIISSLPVSVNNIGIKEWAYVTFFGIFGIASSKVVAIALVSRLLQMLLSLVVIPVYIEGKK